jgi:hypothetical protein
LSSLPVPGWNLGFKACGWQHEFPDGAGPKLAFSQNLHQIL